MPLTIVPTYATRARVAVGFGTRRTAVQLPLYEAPVTLPGTVLEFAGAGTTQDLPVPIPRLPGLDDLEVDRLEFDVSSAPLESIRSIAGNPAAGRVTLDSDAEPNAGVRLRRVEISGLRVTASPSQSFVLEGDGASGTWSHVLFAWDADAGETKPIPNGPAALAHHLHLLVQPDPGTGLGPPAAAAPAFAMPGAGADLYGPALGGAAVSLMSDDAGGVRAVLRLGPELAGQRFGLLLGTAAKLAASEGLPNDVTPVPWSAQTVRALFDVRPAAVTIQAFTPTTGDERPLVAEFAADPGDAPRRIDFAPAARSLLRRAYPLTPGDDLGLHLRFTAASAGALRVQLGTATARYLHYPLAHAPAALDLRGVEEPLDLAVPPGLKPAALSFTLDGTYGPARLTLDSDTAAPELRHGLRLAGPIQVARRVALTAAEAHLPLARLALHGRSSEDCELLATLHRGDALRIGPPCTDPVALPIPPSAVPAWHRAAWSAAGLLPPHPSALWLVVRASRGVFWWHGAPDGSGDTQWSGDDGATLQMVQGRPSLQLAVREVDSTTGHPHPLQPIALAAAQALLNADLVEVTGGPGSRPPQFRRFWIAEGAAHQAFLDGIGQGNSPLRLRFACGRDVDLRLSDVVLTYNPWRA